MNNKQALDAAILAINTVLFPDATSDKDFYWFDQHGDEAIAKLDELRKELT